MEWGRAWQRIGVCLFITAWIHAAAVEAGERAVFDGDLGAVELVSAEGNCECICAEPCWRPICLCGDLAECWCAPFAGSPSGCSGAPRQGWLATPDGFFTKEYHLFYGFTRNRGDSTDIHTGMFQWQYPLSRRVWWGLDVPFSGTVDRGPGLPDLSDFDDITVTGKVLLHETRNVGLTAELGVRTPTGDEDSGGGVTALSPACNWWTDVGGGWSFRGGVGVDIGLSGVAGSNSDTDMLYALAIGQTVTPHERTPWGDFTYYLSVHGRSGIDGPDPHTFLFLGPGIRTHLGGNLFFLTAMQIPVSGPSSFDEQLMFMFVKGL